MQVAFTKDKTLVLKGIALLLMIMHHTCVPTYWAAEGTTVFTELGYFQSVTKMCVYIFAFLVGYGFFCSSNKTVKYSLKRCLLLLVPFWVMLLGMFVPLSVGTGTFPSVVGDNFPKAALNIVYNMFGISESLNWYSWFIAFYIFSILSLPYVHKLIERFPKYGWIAVFLGSYVVECVVRLIPGWDGDNPLHAFFFFTTLFPVVLMGYMCARWNKEGEIPSWFEGKNRIPLAILTIFVALAIMAIKIPTFGFCLQALYTPFLIFAIVGISNALTPRYITKGLIKIGELSMYMWFFHAVFFTTTVNLYTKALVFEPFNCFLWTLLMTFILTYIGSWIIKKLLTPIIQKIK